MLKPETSCLRPTVAHHPDHPVLPSNQRREVGGTLAGRATKDQDSDSTQTLAGPFNLGAQLIVLNANSVLKFAAGRLYCRLTGQRHHFASSVHSLLQ
jgi:hypothetical protein